MDANEELIQNLKRARKASDKPYGFGMIMEDAGGHPALVIAKKFVEAKKKAKEVRKTAKDKKIGLGRVLPTPKKTLVLLLEDGNAKPNILQRAIKRRLAKDAALKSVKGLLQKIEVLTPEDYEKQYGEVPEVSDAPETAADHTKRLEAARAAAKGAFVAAKEVVSAARLAELDDLKDRATKARKDGDLELAADLYEELVTQCNEAVEEDDLPDAVADDGPEVDIDRLHKSFLDAMDRVNDQISALQAALKKSDDGELREIAEFGLNGVTGNFKVPLTRELLAAKMSSGDAREAAFERMADIAEDFLAHIQKEPRVQVCDENPFGVTVNIRGELGGLLQEIVAAV